MSGIIGVSPDMNSGIIGKQPAGNVLQVKIATVVNSVDGPNASGAGNPTFPIETGGFSAKGKNSFYNVAFHCAGGSGDGSTSWNGGVGLQINSGSFTKLTSSGSGNSDDLVYAYYTYGDPRQNKYFESVFQPTSNVGDTMNFKIYIWSTHSGTIKFDGLKMIKVTEIVS